MPNTRQAEIGFLKYQLLPIVTSQNYTEMWTRVMQKVFNLMANRIHPLEISFALSHWNSSHTSGTTDRPLADSGCCAKFCYLGISNLLVIVVIQLCFLRVCCGSLCHYKIQNFVFSSSCTLLCCSEWFNTIRNVKVSPGFLPVQYGPPNPWQTHVVYAMAVQTKAHMFVAYQGVLSFWQKCANTHS